MSHERRCYLFSGRVQGVGFRMTARGIAQAHPVTGYVENLPDGRVKMVVEGEPPAMTRFLDAVRREFEGFIQDLEHVAPPEDEPLFESFSIRH